MNIIDPQHIVLERVRNVPVPGWVDLEIVGWYKIGTRFRVPREAPPSVIRAQARDRLVRYVYGDVVEELCEVSRMVYDLNCGAYPGEILDKLSSIREKLR